MNNVAASWTRWLYRTQIALIAIIVIAIAAGHFNLMAAISAFLMTGLSIALLALIGVIGLVLLVVALLSKAQANAGAWRRNGIIAAVIGVAPLVIVFAVVGGEGFSKPLIHDITTDFDNPPTFSAAVAARTAQENSLDYPGEQTAQLQRQAYPTIQPIETSLQPAAAFDRCMEIVKQLGWQVLEENKSGGVIEAVEQTRLFSFKDDIAIRVTATEKGSRIDLRSVSRVGQGDFGANAARIERFQKAFGAG